MLGEMSFERDEDPENDYRDRNELEVCLSG